jgi:hypothetical protein
MGTFGETTIADYYLSNADQGKQMSIFRNHLQQIKRSLKFPFAKTDEVCRKQTLIAIF